MPDPAPRRTFQIRRESASTPAPVPWQQDLNEEQRLAVMAPERHVLVLAGAGTGKTRVITYRLAWLLQQGLEPAQCFFAAFTVKASREMLHRAETLLQKPLTGLWGGTFHSICARFLRHEAQHLGFTDRFTILDSEDAVELMSQVRTEVLTQPPGQRFPQAKVLDDLYSFARNTNRPAAEVLAARWPQFLELGEPILKILEAYQLRKRVLNTMDYDDLLMHSALVLREQETVRKRWALHFRQVLVDEFQDTNHLQGTLVDLLASEGAGVTVVGDDAQAIYAFRGADYRNLQAFPARYPGAAIYKLEVNYRSTPPILHLANALFAEADPVFRKELRPVKKTGYRPALVAARDADEEAMFIASRVLDLREEGIPLADMGILFRSHSTMLHLELELRKRRIPFQVRGGLRFLEQAHIKDVLAYCILCTNDRDALAWQRVLKLQPKIGPAQALQIWQELEASPVPLEAFLRGKGGRPLTLDPLRDLFKALLKQPPAEGIALITESPYRDVVFSRYTNPQQRLEDLHQLATYAAKYNDLAEFLHEIQLAGGLSAEDLMGLDDPDEKLTLSTVHQAKGLEWPVVFIPHVVEGLIPHWLALREEGGREEERRLLYVAITRAKEELYLSYPQLRQTRTGAMPMLTQLSSFLTELPGGEALFVDTAVIAPPESPAAPAAVEPETGPALTAGEVLGELEDTASGESPFEE